ncbi:MAG TPA: hypothetical protein VMR52_07695 [Dehalococcoidia bacterium]|nr:hypothetical protein [Dehalococcoidia bacterium]
MIAAVYLLTMTIAGVFAVTRFMPKAPVMVRLAGGFVVGIVFNAWITYVVAYALSGATGDSLLAGIIVSIAFNVAVISALSLRFRLSDYRLAPLEIVLIGLALVFSFWLMDQRLTIDQNSDELVVSSNTWGDTALHVALAKSFSEGENYPTEYPFYANEPIRYHFGYDFFAGALGEGGFDVRWSFNLPGALGFAAMMMLLFALARFLFSGFGGGTRNPGSLRNFGVWTGLVAVALLLTNQSFAFIRYFDQFDRAGLGFSEALKPTGGDGQTQGWWDLSRYLALGPYDVGQGVDIISLFNTPNVYLTQTHLIVGMALILFVAFGLVQPLRNGQPLTPMRGAFLGVIFGLSFWINGVLYISVGVFFAALLIVFAGFAAFRHAEKGDRDRFSAEFALPFWHKTKDYAWFFVPALVLAIPQAYWLNGNSLSSDGAVSMHLGYLVCSGNAGCHGVDGNGNAEMDLLSLHDWGRFAWYWWMNIGLAIPLMVLAMVWGSRSDRKIFFAAMMVFVFASTVQLSRDLGGHNHKVINLWEVLVNPFIAFGLVGLWNVSMQQIRVLGAMIDGRVVSYAARALVPVVFFFLVFSGLLDFMTIKNDFKVAVFGERTQSIEWIEENTPRDSVFLTVWGDLYVSPTMAGRRVYLGYDPWVGSAGYDANIRKERSSLMFGAQDKETACELLSEEQIDFVEIGEDERRGSGRLNLNEGLYVAEFTTAGSVDEGRGTVTYYDVAASCSDSAEAAR